MLKFGLNTIKLAGGFDQLYLNATAGSLVGGKGDTKRVYSAEVETIIRLNMLINIRNLTLFPPGEGVKLSPLF